MKKCIRNICGKMFGKSALRRWWKRSGYNTETDRNIGWDVSWPEAGLSQDRVLFRTLAWAFRFLLHKSQTASNLLLVRVKIFWLFYLGHTSFLSQIIISRNELCFATTSLFNSMYGALKLIIWCVQCTCLTSVASKQL